MSRFRPTPDVVITDVHKLAEEMGARRLRIDRSGWGGTDQLPDCWVEVGYGSHEIHVRTSDPDLVYRRQFDKVDMHEVIDMFTTLIDQSGGTT